jgi:hypothetical protein
MNEISIPGIPDEILDNVPDYGFIITRHVNSMKTNHYWNTAIICIRTRYPHKKIIIIDDNSNRFFLRAFFPYKNVHVIQSEFVGRGELLPYYYFHKYKFFKYAVIIHDSVFIHRRLCFEKLIHNGMNVKSIWHFDTIHHSSSTPSTYNRTMNLVEKLNNNGKIKETLSPNTTVFNNDKWLGSFGVQSFIKLSFLEKIERKYNIFNLLSNIKNRTDREGLERIFGVIFSIEEPSNKYNSLLGSIFNYCNFGYTFESYIRDRKRRRLNNPIIKVWTGR